MWGRIVEVAALPDAGFIFGSWQQVNIFTFEQITIDANGNPNPPLSPRSRHRFRRPSSNPSSISPMQPEMVLLNNPGVRNVTQSSGWQANFTPAPEPTVLALTTFGLMIISLNRKNERN